MGGDGKELGAVTAIRLSWHGEVTLLGVRGRVEGELEGVDPHAESDDDPKAGVGGHRPHVPPVAEDDVQERDGRDVPLEAVFDLEVGFALQAENTGVGEEVSGAKIRALCLGVS